MNCEFGKGSEPKCVTYQVVRFFDIMDEAKVL